MFYFPLLDNNHVVNVNCSMFMKWYLGLISAVCQLEPLILAWNYFFHFTLSD